MSSERIFNIFIYFEKGKASVYGMQYHQFGTTDNERLSHLQDSIENDHPIAERFQLPRTFSNHEWMSQTRLGIDLSLFEEGFNKYHAGSQPYCCITPVVDGTPTADVISDLAPFRGEKVGQKLPGDMDDWLLFYTDGQHFHFDQLIYDDYFKAIELLFNAGHFASASKLLMSCIDTLAFVEYGDESGNFKRWLNEFVDMKSIGVDSTELWEFRNSIVHMTNLSSRAVLKGRVSSVFPYIGSDELARTINSSTLKPFNLRTLIEQIGEGIQKWGLNYNADRDKFSKFVERYDSIISDSRLATIKN